MRGQWAPLIGAGWLPRTGRTGGRPGQPGPGHRRAHRPGRAGRHPGGRVLVAVNATPEPDGSHAVHVLPVPDHIRDPLTAAAWGYDDPAHPVRVTPATYAALTRRT